MGVGEEGGRRRRGKGGREGRGEGEEREPGRKVLAPGTLVTESAPQAFPLSAVINHLPGELA